MQYFLRLERENERERELEERELFDIHGHSSPLEGYASVQESK